MTCRWHLSLAVGRSCKLISGPSPAVAARANIVVSLRPGILSDGRYTRLQPEEYFGIPGYECFWQVFFSRYSQCRQVYDFMRMMNDVS